MACLYMSLFEFESGAFEDAGPFEDDAIEETLFSIPNEWC